jgi:hypothetical protein
MQLSKQIIENPKVFRGQLRLISTFREFSNVEVFDGNEHEHGRT